MADTKHSTKDTRPHHDRINTAKRELLAITGILSKLCGNGETPMESNLEWFIPKLDAVSDMLDCIEMDMQLSEEEVAA